MSYDALLLDGSNEAGAALNRDDCMKVLGELQAARERVAAAELAVRSADFDAGVARADAALMQKRLLAAASDIDAERRRSVDATVAGAAVVCAWCSAPLPDRAEAIEAHAVGCSHHPFGRHRRLLEAATVALAAHAAVVARLTVHVAAAEGTEVVAVLRDMVRAVFADDPDAVAAAVRGHIAEAVAAEAARWRQAIEMHGLHTLPANECFQRVLEWMEGEHGPLVASIR